MTARATRSEASERPRCYQGERRESTLYTRYTKLKEGLCVAASLKGPAQAPVLSVSQTMARQSARKRTAQHPYADADQLATTREVQSPSVEAGFFKLLSTIQQTGRKAGTPTVRDSDALTCASPHSDVQPTLTATRSRPQRSCSNERRTRCRRQLAVRSHRSSGRLAQMPVA